MYTCTNTSEAITLNTTRAHSLRSEVILIGFSQKHTRTQQTTRLEVTDNTITLR